VPRRWTESNRRHSLFWPIEREQGAHSNARAITKQARKVDASTRSSYLLSSWSEKQKLGALAISKQTSDLDFAFSLTLVYTPLKQKGITSIDTWSGFVEIKTFPASIIHKQR